MDKKDILWETIKGVCKEANVPVTRDIDILGGASNYSNELLYGEVLGGFVLIPKLLGLRIKTLNKAFKDISFVDYGELISTLPEGPDGDHVLVELPNMKTLIRSSNPLNVVLDTVKYNRCLVIPHQTTPDDYLEALVTASYDARILPKGTNPRNYLQAAKKVSCGSESALGLEAVWYDKDLEFIKDQQGLDFGTFKVLNTMLASNVPERKQRLINFINSENGGFFILGKTNKKSLMGFLKMHEENHAQFTTSSNA